jgi:hypothetical protein
MTWKIKPSSIDPKTAERRLRLISELRDLCLSLAQAKRIAGSSQPLTFKPWTEADQKAWEQLEREAALREESSSQQ